MQELWFGHSAEGVSADPTLRRCLIIGRMNRQRGGLPFASWLLAILAWGCTNPAQEQTDRNKHAEEEKRLNALAALKALPWTASPDQIVSACGAISDVSRALAGAGPSVDLQSDVALRCADGFGGQAKSLLALGQFGAALESATRALRLGGGGSGEIAEMQLSQPPSATRAPRLGGSGEIEEVRQTAAREMALASLPQKIMEASDILKSDPPAALKAIEAAEEALSVAKRNGAAGAKVDQLTKSLVPLAKKVRRAADAENRRMGGVTRRLYAKLLQDKFYDDGLNITVRASGPDATVLQITFVLFDEVWIHNFQKGDLLDEIQKRGFKRVIAADGYSKSWVWTF